MVVDKVAAIAKNARLPVSDIEAFLPEMEEILTAFSALDEVDTEGVALCTQPVVLTDHVREDVEGDCLSQEEALSNAVSKDGFIKGPRVV